MQSPPSIYAPEPSPESLLKTEATNFPPPQPTNLVHNIPSPVTTRSEQVSFLPVETHSGLQFSIQALESSTETPGLLRTKGTNLFPSNLLPKLPISIENTGLSVPTASVRGFLLAFKSMRGGILSTGAPEPPTDTLTVHES